MSDLFGNHIVGFPTRQLICLFSVKPAAVDPSDVAVYYLAEPEAVGIKWNHSELYRDFNFSLHIVSDCDQEKVRITIILFYSAHAPIMHTLIASENPLHKRIRHDYNIVI